MGFAEKVASLRKAKGYTQYDLADTCGVSVDSVRRWETGKQEPRLSELKNLALALGVSAAALMGEDRIVIEHGGVRMEFPNTAEGLKSAQRIFGGGGSPV